MCAVKIKGLDKLLIELRDLPKQVEKEAIAQLKVICDEILADALSRVPVRMGELKGSGRVKAIAGGYSVGFDISYAPYVEFGTGDFVVVPQGYESFAMEFFVSGEGKSRPQPFLFPAFLAKRENIVKEIEQKINGLLKSK